MNSNTKETFPAVTAQLVRDESGTAIMLTQSNTGTDDDPVVLLHPTQLRHIAERYAGVEPAVGMYSQPVKTLARRLQTLAFYADKLFNWVAKESDCDRPDWTHELGMAKTLSELADEFCADLPDPCDADALPVPQTSVPLHSRRDGAKPEQPSLI